MARTSFALALSFFTASISLPVMAATDSYFQGNTLTVILESPGDQVNITSDSGNLKINGADIENLNETGVPVAASGVAFIRLTGSPGVDNVDLSNVGPALGFPQDFIGTEIDLGGGSDSLIGTQYDDKIRGSAGDDVLNGGEGRDTLNWWDNEGNDIFDGGPDDDTVRFDGTGGGDTITVDRPQGADLRMRRGAANSVTVTTTERAESFLGGGNDTVNIGSFTAQNILGISIYGGEGNDTVNASDAELNVIFYWREGEGNDDVFTGSSTFDSIFIETAFAGLVPDAFEISDNNGDLRVDCTGPNSFNIDAAGVERLSISTYDGDDSIVVGEDLSPTGLTDLQVTLGDNDDSADVVGSADTQYLLNGGADNDTLNIDAEGRFAEKVGNDYQIQGASVITTVLFESESLENVGAPLQSIFTVD